MSKRKAEAIPRVRTQAMLARLCGVTPTAMSAWAREDSFPKKHRDAWDLEQVLAWVRREKVESGDLQEQRTRLTRAQADAQEARNKREEGEMVSFSDVERIWSESYADLFAAVDKGFHRLAPKLSGLDAVGILSELQSWWHGAREKLGEQWSAKAE